MIPGKPNYFTLDNFFIMGSAIGGIILATAVLVWAYMRFKEKQLTMGNPFDTFFNIQLFIVLVLLIGSIVAYFYYYYSQTYIEDNTKRREFELDKENILSAGRFPIPITTNFYFGFSIFIPNNQPVSKEYVNILRRGTQFIVEYNVLESNLLIRFNPPNVAENERVLNYDFTAVIEKLPLNRWNHIGIFANERDVLIYLNTNLIKTFRFTNPLDPYTENVIIGENISGIKRGRLANIRYINTAIPVADIEYYNDLDLKIIMEDTIPQKISNTFLAFDNVSQLFS